MKTIKQQLMHILESQGFEQYRFDSNPDDPDNEFVLILSDAMIIQVGENKRTVILDFNIAALPTIVSALTILFCTYLEDVKIVAGESFTYNEEDGGILYGEEAKNYIYSKAIKSEKSEELENFEKSGNVKSNRTIH